MKRLKMFTPRKDAHGHGTDLYTPGGNIMADKGRVMARAAFAESFGILRKNVVN